MTFTSTCGVLAPRLEDSYAGVHDDQDDLPLRALMPTFRASTVVVGPRYLAT
jgi:hypothetical protein